MPRTRAPGFKGLDRASIPCFMIALPDSSRVGETRGFWQGLGFAPQVFGAVDARAAVPGLRYPERLRPPRGWYAALGPRPLASPEVGCYLSHLRLLRHAMALGLPHMLVLEDDAAPCDNWLDCLQAAFRILPRAGLVYLHKTRVMGNAMEVQLESGQRLVASDAAFSGWSTACYVVHHSAMRRMHDALATMRSTPLDVAMDRVPLTRIRGWEVRPYGVSTHDYDSGIERYRREGTSQRGWGGAAARWVARWWLRFRRLGLVLSTALTDRGRGSGT